jgi:1-acyl-sn-glycerol-3-phosphate acyltransferase
VNRLFSVVIIGLPLRLFGFTKVIGRENLPKKGGFIIASNHQHDSDPFFLAVYMWQYEFRYYAKHTLWEIPFIGWLVGGVLSGAGQIPMNRVNTLEASKSLARGSVALKEKKVIGIFPEGTKSRDGKLHKGHIGVSRTAFAAGASILPTARVIVKGFWKRNEIHIGPMIEVSYVESPTKEQYRALTDKVMTEIQKLSGQEYVDEYAAKRSK